MPKHLRITISTWNDDDSAPDAGNASSTLDITDLEPKIIEDSTLSAAKQLVRTLFDIPTPIKEGGRG